MTEGLVLKIQDETKINTEKQDAFRTGQALSTA